MNHNKNNTILLVEDEGIIALAEKKILEKHGYNVIAANSGEEACNITGNNSDIDLILMDIDLGEGMDGPEAAERILSRKSIPVVFLSSHTEPEIVEKTEQITSYGYVVKNSGITVLLASIKMAFRLFEANRQIQESEVKLRAMITNISDVIGIIGSDGILKYKSQNIEKWFGWEPCDLVGKDYKVTIHPDDKERMEKEFLKLLPVDNLTVSVEFRYRCKNDIYKWVELTAVNCISNPAINGVLINYHNITERKQAEEAIEKRIIALTRPLIHDTAVDFNDLFNLDDIQLLQDQFASAAKVASIITRPDGTPITRPSNFTRLCSEIVRNTETGRLNCYKSDAVLGAPNPGGPLVQPCLSGGLWDAGASITIGGHHIANWLVGQVRDETQTDEAMLNYARKIGADETEFLNAFHEVPSMTQDQFRKVAQSLYTLANQMSNYAYQNMEQARFINERKKIEEALRNSEKIHRLLADNVSDVIWTMDFSGHFTYVSPSVEKLRGYTTGEVLQQSLQDSLTPESAAIAQAAFENAVVQLTLGSGDPEFHGEIEQLCKDGSTVWTEVRTSIMRNDSGEVVSILGVTRDISERRRADAALKESEEKYRILVEHSSDLIWSLDSRGDFVYASPSWERITGYTPSAIIGTNFSDIVHTDDYQVCMDAINKAIQLKEIQHSPVYRIKHADGSWHLHEAAGTPVIGPDGVSISIVGFSRDITESREAEEKIQNLLKEKELILKEVHHRVKNNMSTILNLLTLQLDMQDNPHTKGVLFDAAGRVQSMMVLYDKLYRSDSESVLSVKEYFTALVEEITGLFPGKESVDVKMDIDDILLTTKILSPLGIIINELITNSMKYAFSGMIDCEIVLKVFIKDNSVQIIFRDNGKGLPESVSFEKSTGFGMQLISMLTSQIKGRVRIDREGGTCFTIEFDI
jgi:PAS domain S-box-containing protein